MIQSNGAPECTCVRSWPRSIRDVSFKHATHDGVRRTLCRVICEERRDSGLVVKAELAEQVSKLEATIVHASVFVIDELKRVLGWRAECARNCATVHPVAWLRVIVRQQHGRSRRRCSAHNTIRTH